MSLKDISILSLCPCADSSVFKVVWSQGFDFAFLLIMLFVNLIIVMGKAEESPSPLLLGCYM